MQQHHLASRAELWNYVADQMMGTRTAEECCLRSMGKAASKRLFHPSKKQLSVTREAPTVSAKAGTLAHKREIRDFLQYTIKV